MRRIVVLSWFASASWKETSLIGVIGCLGHELRGISQGAGRRHPRWQGVPQGKAVRDIPGVQD